MKTGWVYSDKDIDRVVRRKEVVGRLTPWRLWMIYQWVCRMNVGHIHVGSPYDCSGQKCGQYCHMEVVDDRVEIEISESFDY